MKVHRIYADAAGESHFEDVEVELGMETPGGRVSAKLPATGVIFREVPPTYRLDWHPAPRRQYVVNLEGAVEITASDGESRVIGPGEILLAEDTTGRGHRSRAVDARPRRCLFIPIE